MAAFFVVISNLMVILLFSTVIDYYSVLPKLANFRKFLLMEWFEITVQHLASGWDFSANTLK